MTDASDEGADVDAQVRAILAAFKSSSSLEDIKENLNQALPPLGYASYTYLAIDLGTHSDRTLPNIGTDLVALTNLDPAWTLRYVQRRYLDHDPIARACYQSRSPVIWTASQAPPGLTQEAEEMMADAATYGISRGITIPVHGFAGEIGILSLYSMLPDAQFLVQVHRDELLLQRMAFALHDVVHSRFVHRSAGATITDIAIRGRQQDPS